MMASATYLYCIVHAQRAPRAGRAPKGLAGATRPSLLEVDTSLWIVVAAVPLATYGPEPLETALRDMSWVADVAVAHEAVVEHFARQPDVTVIPMKLFTMFSSPERAVQETRSQRRGLKPVLMRIAGCEEWGVRMIRTIPAASRRRAGAAAGAAPVKAGSGAAFLAAKKQARDDARDAVRAAAVAADTVFETLTAVARDARRRTDAPEGTTSPPVLDAAFLVPIAGRARFRSAARRLAAGSTGAGTELTLTGPWPAYNFVHGEVG
ncbi:MAG: GvpL/GvpF family gas vesicle protein [Acidobacteriota bacterium]